MGSMDCSGKKPRRNACKNENGITGSTPGPRHQRSTAQSFSRVKRLRVIIVDDQPMFRERLGQVVKAEPTLVLSGEAGTFEEGLKLIATRKPHLVIAELRFQRGDGLEFVKEVRARNSRLCILVVTTADESLHAERAIRAGAQGFISKHETTNTIREGIRHVLQGGIYLTPATAVRLAAKAANTSPSRRDPIERLTDRELRVFELLGIGFGTRRIAEDLKLHVATIETYRSRIKEKLRLKDATELRQHAIFWRQLHWKTTDVVLPTTGF